MQKLARIGLVMIGSFFLIIALACIGYVMVNGLDVGKMYKEHRAKQRLEELQKSSPRLTFLEFCQQKKLECVQSIEYGNGYIAQSTEVVFYPFWESKGERTKVRFGWEDSQRVFNSEQGGYRSSESFWGSGPKFTSKSDPHDIPLPPKVPATK